jgi:DNA-binding response OmpR family regulator
MADSDFSRASVLLFDPVHANQRTTRYALHEIGFRQIDTVASIGEFRSMVSDLGPTLIVAESSATDADVFGLVRAVRRGELGNNPFAVILLTTWSRDTGHIRRAIECGADDVIVRPFSTKFAEERVKTLIHGRKQFIVTSDYIGPDRRKDTERNSDAQPVTVPNILKAMVENDQDALSTAAGWIQEAKETVRAERLRRLAMRIVVSVELHASKSKADDRLPMKLDTSDLLRTGRELKAQLIKAQRAEAAEIAEALLDQVRSMGDGGDVRVSNLKLVKELAMGAYAAFANGDTLERSKDEIGRTVTNLRKRLKAKAEAVQQRRADIAAQQARSEADNDTAVGAGQGAEPGIKRAAM